MSDDEAKVDELDFDDNDNFEVAQDEVKVDEEQVVPTPMDTEWTEYVLSKLTDDEKFQGAPTTDGLRRITELVLGPIISCKTNVVQAPSPDNERRATVVVSLAIGWGYDREDIRNFDGAADVYHNNTQHPFENFPIATAETRAEGRALRRALKLQQVRVAEELSNSDSAKHNYDEAESKPTGCISSTQQKHIEVICQRLDISIKKFVNSISKASQFRDVKTEEYDKLHDAIVDYQRTEGSIPDDIKGWDENWSNDF